MFMSESCRLNLAIGWRGVGVRGGEVCTKIRHAQGKMATAVTFYKMADFRPHRSLSLSPSLSVYLSHTSTHSRRSLSPSPAVPSVAAPPPQERTRSLEMRTE